MVMDVSLHETEITQKSLSFPFSKGDEKGIWGREHEQRTGFSVL
jgi:hypothetical protein